MKIRTDFSGLRVGDKLTRLLAMTVKMTVVVGEIKEKTFKVGSEDESVPWQEGWIFSKETGLEIDEELGWDGKSKTGSFILEEN